MRYLVGRPLFSVLKRVDKGVKANVLNRFFGQKPQEEPKKDTVASQERVESDSVSEQSFNPFKNSLSRTRQIFSRMGDAFRQNEITTELWDELEEFSCKPMLVPARRCG